MKTPIDDFLDVQADLSAVERFARTEVPGRSGQWSELIPLSRPSAGQQFRFEVDLDRCTGCKACVTACHSLNGLDEGESFRSIGLLVADAEPDTNPTAPAQQTVTTACHHCADPGCLNGCPAEAYKKDPVTGIVRHLDDACIGCRYCTLTCPYDVPVYNDRLGIVRKCDMCADRLADGEAPACVQGCPTEAISISVVDVASVAQTAPNFKPANGHRLTDAPERLVPGAAPSQLTEPTTLYIGRALQDRTRAVDAVTVRPQHAHLPLVLLLVLSQASVGIVAAAVLWLVIVGVGDGMSPIPTLSVLVGAALAASSVVASVSHLGQPRKAWRVVLGWSHSWLSREATILGGYVGAVLVGAITLPVVRSWGLAVLTAAVGIGVAAVGCSAMIYVVTGRTWWRASQTYARFGGTVLLAGTSWFAVAAVADARWDVARLSVLVVTTTLAAKLWIERSVLRQVHPDLQRTAVLLRGELAPIDRVRTRVALSGAVLLVASVLGNGDDVSLSVGLAVIGAIAIAAGELWERRLFFLACAPVMWPGGHR